MWIYPGRGKIVGVLRGKTNMSLQLKLENELQHVSGTFGVAVKHLQTGESAAINADRLFQLASTFKVAVLAALYRDVEAGKQALEGRIQLKEEDYVPGSGVLKEFDVGVQVSVKDLATLMIIVSDNVATDRILKLIGTENVAAYVKELGLHHTFINYSCWELINLCVGLEPGPYSREVVDQIEQWKFDYNSIVFQEDPRNNVGTVTDMSRLIEMIAKKELISEAACDAMMEILFKQQVTGRLPYLLPAGTKVAHKTGDVDHVVNDVGVIYLPDDRGAFSVAVLSRDNRSLEEGERTIGRLARTAYDHFMNA
jgi:beta-lactamase class A